MNEPLRSEKRNLRRDIGLRIDSLETGVLAAESTRIRDYLRQIPEWREARTVLAFLSMESEIDTYGFIAEALDEEKHVAVPRMHGDEIGFHLIEHQEGPWDPHPYGVREPPAWFPPADPENETLLPMLIITPGLAFDRDGRRLGHGAGFYDKFFSRVARACGHPQGHLVPDRSADHSLLDSVGALCDNRFYAAAVCATCQIVDRVPVNGTDYPVDAVITGDGVAYRRTPSSQPSPG